MRRLAAAESGDEIGCDEAPLEVEVLQLRRELAETKVRPLLCAAAVPLVASPILNYFACTCARACSCPPAPAPATARVRITCSCLLTAF